MDTSDPEITFNEEGLCNHCTGAEKQLKMLYDRRKAFDLDGYIAQIKKDGEGKKYDCIIGISGGVDSCYVMHLAKKVYGLRPLAVHIDNGWDSELAVENIKNILEKLAIDLYTYVVDWQEFRDLQLSFLKASTPDIEIPSDHMIFPVISLVCHKYDCVHAIMGHNSASESILPRTWSHGHFDWKYIKGLHKQFGSIPLKTFPHFTRADMDYFNRLNKWFNILDYIDYDKEKSKKLLMDEYGWRDYGGKHYESFYTKIYQTYLLPIKFGYDKRRAHLSSLIMVNQLTREEALEQMSKCSYDESRIDRDIEYFIEKMEITKEEFDEIMARPVKSYYDYPNMETDAFGKLIAFIASKIGGANNG